MDEYDILNTSSNPQPPPLTAEEKEILESDKIGDTAYSKKWVLSVLLHMVEDLKKTTDEKKDEKISDKNSEDRQESAINPELEEELCELWDMTMDSDVSKYLLAEDAVDLILEAILQTSSLRKLEIGLGILANMACTPEVCKAIVQHSTLSDVTLFHIDNPDVRTLIELCRLISVCISNKESKMEWIKILKEKSVVNKLIFILENSLNVELLDGVTEIVDQLIYCDDKILDELSTEKLVTVICDVYRRTAVKHPQTVQSILHILQLISTTEKGVSALAAVEDSGNIAKIILVEGSKYFAPLQSNFPSLVSSCCILNVLMASVDKQETLSKRDFKILLTVLSLTEQLADNVSSGSEDDQSLKDLKTKECNKDKQTENEEDVDAKEDGSSVYKKYLDAVVDFLLLLTERFVATEITNGMLVKLKERGTQLARIVAVLKAMPEHNSAVEKFELALRKSHVFEEKSDKDGDN